VLLVEGVNVYDVLRHRKLLVTKPALAAIESRLARSSRETES
jgi:ribosomal protein L4